MNLATIILALLLGTSAIMTVAMGVAWVHFGRQRYVLIWTFAYVAATAQWAANVVGLWLENGLWMGLSAAGTILTASLILLGLRVRAGLPMRWRPMLWVGAMAAVASFYAALVGDRPLRSVMVAGYVGALLLCSAAALWPRERRFTAPETALFAMFMLFALFEASLSVAASLDMGRGAGAGMATNRALMALCLPSIYVGTAVAAVLVVAGDLAQQLRRQMGHDPLTGVLNRRGLDDAAARAIALARRHQRPLALVVCDLDRFKALNDGHGHIAGDAALRGFAQLLAGAVRRGDIIGRMGGDEFGLLLIDTDAAAAAEVMERVRAEICHLILPNAPHAHLGASFGIAELMADDAMLEEMVLRADAALYVAKREGKDRVSIWRSAA